MIETHYNLFLKSYVKPKCKAQRTTLDSVIPTDTSYIPREIISLAHKELTHKRSCTIIIPHNGDVKLDICYDQRKHRGVYLDFVVFWVSWILYILPLLTHVNIPSLHIKVFLTSSKKEFPLLPEQQLSPINVNSGVTIFRFTENRNDVIVYRKEEVFKVLLHELIHALNIDGEGRFDTDLEEPIREIFGKTNELYIKETYTDTLTLYLNVLFFSLIYAEKRGISWKTVYDQLMDIERRHMFYKARDVLLFEGIRITRDGPVGTSIHKGEKTHVIAYYVLKAVIYSNLMDCQRYYNKNGLVLKDQNEFVKLIKKNFKRFWRTLSLLGPTPDNSRYSLRMSKIDVEHLINMKNKST